jgi:hypothetical protein
MDHYYLIHWCDWILTTFVIRDPVLLAVKLIIDCGCKRQVFEVAISGV